MRNLTRAAAAGAATTALGAAAMVIGAATQESVPAAPIVLAADTEDTAQQDLIARMVAEMTREEDPDGWDSRYGDGSGK